MFRSLGMWFAEGAYSLIPQIYDVFDELSKLDYFNNEYVKTIMDNLYLLVSAVMLFAFAFKLISSIVNPDLLTDKKKGFQKIVINSIIGVILIGGLPLIYQEAQKLQNNIINNNLINKYLFGYSTDQNIGYSFMTQSFKSFCKINDEFVNKDDDTKVNQVKNAYNSLISANDSTSMEKGFKRLKNVIKTEYNDSYIIDFNWIISPIFGAFVCYQLILLLMDTALRGFKLIFLQLLSPIVICAFIFSGSDILKKWAKEIVSTYLLIFIKIITLDFIILGMTLLDSTLGDIGFGIMYALILIGLLQMIKQIPNMINAVFGIKIQDDGGIGGRLAGMAGVGGLAKQGWDAIRKHPIQSATRPIGAVAGAATNTINSGVQRYKNSKSEHGSRLRAVGAGLVGAGSGTLGTIGAARRGWRNGTRAVGTEVQRYRDVHQKGSTWGGRFAESTRQALGFKSRPEAEMVKWDRRNDEYTFEDETGTNVTKNEQEMNEIKANLTIKISENKNNNRLEQDIINNQKIVTDQIEAAVKRADAKLQEADSTYKLSARSIIDLATGEHVTFAGGNLSAFKEMIDNYKEARPNKDSDKYKILNQNYQQELATYQQGIDLIRNSITDPTQQAQAIQQYKQTHNIPVQYTFNTQAYEDDFNKHISMSHKLDEEYKKALQVELRNDFFADAINPNVNGDAVVKEAFKRINQSGITDANGNAYIIDQTTLNQAISNGQNAATFVKSLDDGAKAYISEKETIIMQNDANTRNYQTALNNISRAEEEHKEARAEFEASQEHQAKIADQNSVNASRNNSSGNSNSNSNSGNRH